MRDNAPVGYTCPDIGKMISLLEELRNANSELRAWGQTNYEELQKAEAQIEDLDDRIEKLDGKIEELEHDNVNLEKKVSQLEDEISDLQAENASLQVFLGDSQ